MAHLPDSDVISTDNDVNSDSDNNTENKPQIADPPVVPPVLPPAVPGNEEKQIELNVNAPINKRGHTDFLELDYNTQKEIDENPFEFNGYKFLAGRLPHNPSDDSQTATLLCWHRVTEVFHMTTANNIDWHGPSMHNLYQSSIVFTGYPIDQFEMCVNNNIICIPTAVAVPTCFYDITVCMPPTQVILNWDPANSLRPCNALINDAGTLRMVKKQLFLKMDKNARHALEMQRRINATEANVVQCTKEMIKKHSLKKLTTSIQNRKNKWAMKFICVSPPIAFGLFGKWNHVIKDRERCNFTFSDNGRSFSSTKEGGKCPAFVFNGVFFNGKYTLIRHSADKSVYTYYDCWVRYSCESGILSFGAKLKHRNPGPNTNWQI